MTKETMTVESTEEKVVLYDHRGRGLTRSKQMGFVKDKEKENDKKSKETLWEHRGKRRN